MNSFANSLFSLLFGWARSLIQRVWSAASAGEYSSFLVWLGDHWVWVALVLCLACTAADFIIWLIRWQPYLVWRTLARRVRSLLHGKRPVQTRRFDLGYQGGVALDISQQDAVSPPPPEWEEDLAEETPPDDAPSEYSETLQPVFPPEQPDGEGRQRQFVPPAYEPPPMVVPARQVSGFSAAMPASRRRRRSERYEKKRPEWSGRFMTGSDEEDAMLDGLPPAVDRQDAFHEPVYPRNSAAGNSGNPYAGWQRPQPANDQTDGQA